MIFCLPTGHEPPHELHHAAPPLEIPAQMWYIFLPLNPAGRAGTGPSRRVAAKRGAAEQGATRLDLKILLFEIIE